MSTPVDDPRILRAIAHPVRNRILTELGTGALRAADVADRLGIPANQASFHLRQLAKYGLVDEDPEAARDKRDRVWRAVSASGLVVDIAEFAGQPDKKAAAAVYVRSVGASAHRLVDAAYRYPREEPFTHHESNSEDALRLTSEQARELRDELTALIDSWRARTGGPDSGAESGAGPITYALHTMLLPYPETER